MEEDHGALVRLFRRYFEVLQRRGHVVRVVCIREAVRVGRLGWTF